MKRSRTRWLLPLVLFTPLVAAACGIQDNPDGWAAPTPVSVEGETLLILGSGEAALVAIEAETGVPRWVFPDADESFPGLSETVDAGAFYSAPARIAATGEIVLGTYEDGIVYAIQADGSSARVLLDTGSRVIADVVVEGTRLYVATSDHKVYALDAEAPPATRDDALWIFEGSDKEIWGTPALVSADGLGSLLLVPSMDGRLYALHTEDGSVAWTFRASGSLPGGVVTDGVRAFVGSFDHTFYAIDLATGAVAWQHLGENWFWTTPLVQDGVVYAADLSGAVWAWDAATGAPQWSGPFRAADGVRARILPRDDGSLYLITRKGRSYLLDAATGAARWEGRVDVPGDVLADPLDLDGRILVHNESGDLFQVDGPDTVRPVFPPVEA